MKKKLLLFTIILINYLYPQENSLELFPSGLNFIPLKANTYEAKMGLIYIPANNNMKIDIGDNIDFLSFRLSDSERLTAGIEFFAYALSKSYKEFRLQIDAIDGLFGGNISYSKFINDNQLTGRFRIIHNSAHLVDGHWDFHNNRWIDNYKPEPYSRDFTDLTIAYNYNLNFTSLRNYAALQYAFLVRPSDVKRFNFNTGFEAGFNQLSGSFLGKNYLLFLAYDFLLSGAEKFSGSNNYMLGIKFGSWYERGLQLFLSYYNGLDVFHAYYKRKIKYFGIGFSIDLL